jgi:hypothetical protein
VDAAFVHSGRRAVKATINVEFGSEELQKFVLDVGVKAFTKGFGMLDASIPPAQQAAMFQKLFQWFETTLTQESHAHHAYRGRPRSNGVPPQPSTGPFGSPVPQAWPPPEPQPIHGEPPHVDRCFAIEANRNTEAGIGCCQCATNNALTRTNCRRCGHKLCVVVTPPPAQGPVTESPE